jgi:pilus assembly protein CpaE
MATLDLPSVRNMGVFLGTLEKLKIPNDNIRLILNKAETDVGIDVDQVTRLFPQGFASVLPYAKEVSRSINLGVPVLASSPSAPVSKLILDGFRELLPASDQEKMPASAPALEASRFRRMFRRQPAPQAR